MEVWYSLIFPRNAKYGPGQLYLHWMSMMREGIGTSDRYEATFARRHFRATNETNPKLENVGRPGKHSDGMFKYRPGGHIELIEGISVPRL
jgi:hypothetical protein